MFLHCLFSLCWIKSNLAMRIAMSTDITVWLITHEHDFKRVGPAWPTPGRNPKSWKMLGSNLHRRPFLMRPVTTNSLWLHLGIQISTGCGCSFSLSRWLFMYHHLSSFASLTELWQELSWWLWKLLSACGHHNYHMWAPLFSKSTHTLLVQMSYVWVHSFYIFISFIYIFILCHLDCECGVGGYFAA